jgi:hypothetical protein
MAVGVERADKISSLLLMHSSGSQKGGADFRSAVVPVAFPALSELTYSYPRHEGFLFFTSIILC